MTSHVESKNKKRKTNSWVQRTDWGGGQGGAAGAKRVKVVGPVVQTAQIIKSWGGNVQHGDHAVLCCAFESC